MTHRRLPIAPPDDPSRRRFLEAVLAALALAGGEGCSRPRGRVAPFRQKPDEMTPGNPLRYATAVDWGLGACGLVVTTREGRPIRVDGNPEHPDSLGATSAIEQACVLDLYDPYRARVVTQRGEPRSFRAYGGAMRAQAARLVAVKGRGLHLLLPPSGSRLRAWMLGKIRQAFPESRVHAWAPAGDDQAYAGAQIAFGRALSAHCDYGRADVLVLLDADVVGAMPGSLRASRQIADRRLPGKLNRIYAVEGTPSLAGTMADHRLRVRTGEVAAVALALLGEVARRAPGAPEPIKGSVGGLPASPHAKWIAAVARDLARVGPAALVVAGPRQPAEVHSVAHALNAILGSAAVGFTAPAIDEPAHGPAALSELAAAIDRGEVDTLISAALDPAWTAPADLDLATRLARVPTLIHTALRVDATARHAAWFLPAAHPLESWGDERARDGTLSLVQPMIAPLFDGVTLAEVLAPFVGDESKSPHDLLVEAMRAERPKEADFDAAWEKWLHDGVVPDTRLPAETPAPQWAAIADAARRLAKPRAPSGLEATFATDARVLDGRFAENAWLQELPDPVTKQTWGNAAWISPKTAKELGVKSGDVVRLSLAGRSVEAPILVVPGHADGSVTLPVGYGRTAGSPVGAGVGFDAYRLRTAGAPWIADGLAITRTGAIEELAITQKEQSSMGRPLALSFPEHELVAAATGELERMREPPPTLYPQYAYDGHRWGMAIDLARCTGCSACVMACVSENNIPVVGPEDVRKGREMHWLRVDRYRLGEGDDPEIVHQPLACVHCEHAPCEYVCPVNATVHSDEGLNEMVYNRCVGTRYCSNNCPYKVRRFNWFDYQKETTPVERMRANPEVTLRSRGVMEKCSYCVQRIERGRIDARVAGRPLGAEDVKTACQEACPAGAIVFGSLHDPRAQVSRMHADPRRYDLLHELNTRPRTVYLARIRNPNPEIVG